jgi:hypothetical protein
MKKERIWMDCHTCNGKKEVRYLADILPEEGLKYEVIPCSSCNGNGGWWITTSVDDCCG